MKIKNILIYSFVLLMSLQAGAARGKFSNFTPAQLDELSGVVHDLGNPLSAIVGLAQLQEDAAREADQLEKSEEFKALKETADAILRDVRDFMKEAKAAVAQAGAHTPTATRSFADIEFAVSLTHQQLISQLEPIFLGPIDQLEAKALQMQERARSREEQKSLGLMHTSAATLRAMLKGESIISEVNIAKMLEEMVALFGEKARLNGLSLELKIESAPLGLVRLDAVGLNRALINLLGNALKFTQKGGITIHLKTSQFDSQRVRLDFAVQDTGPGIAPDRLEAIFAKFEQEQADTAARFGGSGVGLWNVRDFVEKMHGRVWVESVVGEGSIFHISLLVQLKKDSPSDSPADTITRRTFSALHTPPSPAHTTPVLGGAGRKSILSPLHGAGASNSYSAVGAMPAAASSLAAAASSDAPQKPFAGKRALIVDDTQANLMVGGVNLTALGFQVTKAGSGEDAVAKIQAGERFDVIWMDIQMKAGMIDGYEATRQIVECAPEALVIGMSAHEVDEVLAHGSVVGMKDAVQKPASKASLQKVAQKYLR